MHSDAEAAGPPQTRHPHIRAALPVLASDTLVDLVTLRRVAAALRSHTDDDRVRTRSNVSGEIEQLRRDMGNTIADLWTASPEVVHCG